MKRRITITPEKIKLKVKSLNELVVNGSACTRATSPTRTTTYFTTRILSTRLSNERKTMKVEYALLEKKYEK